MLRFRKTQVSEELELSNENQHSVVRLTQKFDLSNNSKPLYTSPVVPNEMFD